MLSRNVCVPKFYFQQFWVHEVQFKLDRRMDYDGNKHLKALLEKIRKFVDSVSYRIISSLRFLQSWRRCQPKRRQMAAQVEESWPKCVAERWHHWNCRLPILWHLIFPEIDISQILTITRDVLPSSTYPLLILCCWLYNEFDWAYIQFYRNEVFCAEKLFGGYCKMKNNIRF